MGTLLISIALI